MASVMIQGDDGKIAVHVWYSIRGKQAQPLPWSFANTWGRGLRHCDSAGLMEPSYSNNSPRN